MTAASRLWHEIAGLSNKEESLFHKERQILPCQSSEKKFCWTKRVLILFCVAFLMRWDTRARIERISLVCGWQ